jgi:hypothetical protein
MKTARKPELKSMKKFTIREAETLKTTRPALYDPSECPWVLF